MTRTLNNLLNTTDQMTLLLSAYFERTMDSAEISRAFEINSLKPDLGRPSISHDHVPMNIVQLTSSTSQVHVQYKPHSGKQGPPPSVISKIFQVDPVSGTTSAIWPRTVWTNSRSACWCRLLTCSPARAP